MAFARGFKTRCENIAESIRVDLDRAPSGPLPADELARYVGVELIVPADIPGMSAGSLGMLEDESDDWSALTISGPAGTLVVSNPQNSAARHYSDLAHECAHLLLRHTPSTLMFAPDGTWTLLSYDEQQEEEAGWLGGCLLLPRPALLRIARSGLAQPEATARYGVSQQLLRYRMDVTGVRKQTTGRRTARSAP